MVYIQCDICGKQEKIQIGGERGDKIIERIFLSQFKRDLCLKCYDIAKDIMDKGVWDLFNKALKQTKKTRDEEKK